MPDLLLRAGAARVDITPTRMCDLTGFLLRDNPAAGVHDPIYARALALDDGRRRALLIVCDVLGMEPAFVAKQRLAIERATGVPATNIVVACTHTHSAPAAMPLVHCGEIDPDWLGALPGRLVEAAEQALRSLVPALASSDRAPTPPVCANRRDPADVVDRDLDILRLDGPDGPIAALLVYGCHPVAAGHANRQVSADYFGVLAAAIERATGAVALATSGACGDVDPAIDGDPFVERPTDLALVRHVGEGLAGAALAAWPNLAPVADPRIGVSAVRLALPLGAIPSPEALSELAAGWRAGQIAPTDPAWAGREAAAMLAWAEQIAARRREGALSAVVDAEVQALALGDVALVGVPGELFAALGLAVKRAAPARHTIVLGYASGNIGYIPTRAAYERGGYEVASAFRFYGYPAALDPAAGEMVVEAALAAAARALQHQQ